MARRNRSAKQAKAARRRAAARTRLRRDPLLGDAGQWAAEAERLGREWAAPRETDASGRGGSGEAA